MIKPPLMMRFLKPKPVAAVFCTLRSGKVTEVALATPRIGVTSVGDVANTKAPLPVSFVTAAAKLADEGVAKNVATPVAKPLTPVEIGRPVPLVSVTDWGVPKIGVTSVGDVPNTLAPVPVSSVSAPAKLAEVNEPREVALPDEVIAPVRLALVVTLPAVKPDAVPVMFVPTKAVGVPSAGVTKVGLFDRTTATDPVDDVTPVPPLDTGSVPLT